MKREYPRPPRGEEAAGTLKNGKIAHIDGAGHNARRERKAALLTALKDFLATF